MICEPSSQAKVCVFSHISRDCCLPLITPAIPPTVGECLRTAEPRCAAVGAAAGRGGLWTAEVAFRAIEWFGYGTNWDLLIVIKAVVVEEWFRAGDVRSLGFLRHLALAANASGVRLSRHSGCREKKCEDPCDLHPDVMFDDTLGSGC